MNRTKIPDIDISLISQSRAQRQTIRTLCHTVHVSICHTTANLFDCATTFNIHKHGMDHHHNSSNGIIIIITSDSRVQVYFERVLFSSLGRDRREMLQRLVRVSVYNDRASLERM